jgi:hypothetical protein
MIPVNVPVTSAGVEMIVIFLLVIISMVRCVVDLREESATTLHKSVTVCQDTSEILARKNIVYQNVKTAEAVLLKVTMKEHVNVTRSTGLEISVNIWSVLKTVMDMEVAVQLKISFANVNSGEMSLPTARNAPLVGLGKTALPLLILAHLKGVTTMVHAFLPTMTKDSCVFVMSMSVVILASTVKMAGVETLVRLI